MVFRVKLNTSSCDFCVRKKICINYFTMEFSFSPRLTVMVWHSGAEYLYRSRYSICNPNSYLHVNMANTTESMAKDAMITFFVESVDPYLRNYSPETLRKFNKWICRIAKHNVYSAKTHLMTLCQMIKTGKISPPFSDDPDTTRLSQLNPHTTTSKMEHISRLLSSTSHLLAKFDSRPSSLDSRMPPVGRLARKDFIIPERRKCARPRANITHVLCPSQRERTQSVPPSSTACPMKKVGTLDLAKIYTPIGGRIRRPFAPKAKSVSRDLTGTVLKGREESKQRRDLTRIILKGGEQSIRPPTARGVHWNAQRNGCVRRGKHEPDTFTRTKAYCKRL